jgi:hypothetical protein
MRKALAFGLVACGMAQVARAGEPVKVDTYKAEGQVFIDDPFDFSADGKSLAYITTDGAKPGELHFVSPGSKDPEVKMGYPSITPERIDFLDGERILVVERNPETRMAKGQIYTRKGPGKDKLGPASDIVLATVGGVPAIVTYTRAAKGNSATHTLTAVRRDNLKPLGKKVLNESGEGRVAFKGGAFKLLFFEDAYTELIGQKEGEYDSKHDIRKPDHEARIDVFGEKIIKEREIPDLVEWNKVILMRKKHQNESSFVQFSEDQKHLLLVDSDDVESELKTPHPLDKYEVNTLAYQPVGPAAMVMSLTVDPVNAAAVRAQKADRDWLDIYKLDVKGRALEEIARIDGLKRPSAWRLVGSRLGVLRKHKGFARGGMELEVYDLPGLVKAEPPKKEEPVAPKKEEAAPAKKEGAAAPAPAKKEEAPKKK